MDDERAKARSWNGYVCPGCRTVFRVAGDFNGTDVICPSCHETLRLPKSPDEPEPLIAPVEPPPVMTSVVHPQTIYDDDRGKSPVGTLLSTRDGQIKLASAMLIPVAVIAAVLLFFPFINEAPSVSSAADPAQSQPEPESPLVSAQATKPPPPPVAVSEISLAPDIAPAAPLEEPPPMPEIAASEPVLEPAVPTPVPEPEVAALAPATPEVSPHPALPEVIPAADPEKELVAAIPDAPMPVAKEPVPIAAPETEPIPAVAAQLSHTVVRGDTLAKIASTYQVNAATIKQANRMKSDVVMLDQKLSIPGGTMPETTPETTATEAHAQPEPAETRSHTVVRGDTLTRIARKYQVDPREIMKANGMKNDVVRLGRKLVIPSR